MIDISRILLYVLMLRCIIKIHPPQPSSVYDNFMDPLQNAADRLQWLFSVKNCNKSSQKLYHYM